MTKNSYPNLAWIFIGPQTSKCTSSSGSVALIPFVKNDILVISKHFRVKVVSCYTFGLVNIGHFPLTLYKQVFDFYK